VVCQYYFFIFREPSKIDVYNQISNTKNEESKGEEFPMPLAYSEVMNEQ
jgi:hypothetical protein